METKIPFDKNYTDLLGEAVYVFAYYEWTIIYIIECLEKDFVHKYSRKNVMTSGDVYKHFKEMQIKDHEYEFDIEICRKKFDDLCKLRNALIHAHPITAEDESQILNYQTKPNNTFHDFQWTISAIRDFISQVNLAEEQAAHLLDNLRPGQNSNNPKGTL